MNNHTDWLPDLVLFSAFNGDWHRYLDALYGYFTQDFIASRPSFRGQRLGLKRNPLREGKEATFWHFIQSGPVEEDRLPDLRRCERIRWPKPIIEAVDSRRIRCWMNTRQNGEAYVLALEDFSYKVVIAIRNGYLMLYTAFYVEEEHQRRKMEREYLEFNRHQNS